MSMNYIVLSNTQDLQNVLNTSFLLTGNIYEHERETEHNMWAMAFADTQRISITDSDLITFFTSLRVRIEQQLRDSGSKFPVTLYVWFDEQAGQLRFNIISGHVEKLPFGCTVKMVSEPISIIQSCLSSPYLQGIPEDECEYVSQDDDQDDDDVEYVSPIYVDYIDVFQHPK